MYCNSIQNEYNESTLYLQQGLYVLSIGWIFWIIINAYCRTFIGKITFILYTILGLPIVMLFLAKIGKLRVIVIGVEVKSVFFCCMCFFRDFLNFDSCYPRQSITDGNNYLQIFWPEPECLFYDDLLGFEIPPRKQLAICNDCYSINKGDSMAAFIKV